MSNKHVKKGNFTFTTLNFYTLMLLCAITTGMSMEEETMTSSIYKEPESKSQDSASDNVLNQLDSIDETVTFSITNENSGDENDNEHLENEKFDNSLLEGDEKESSSSSSWTRNLVTKERKRPQSEEEKKGDNCVPQNKTDKRKTLNISATTSTVTKISIIMDGDDEDDNEDDDACSTEIASFTTETTTKKCSVCTSKNIDECNKGNVDQNNKTNDHFEQVPTRFVCTVTTEELPTEGNNKDTNDNSLENQEDLNNVADDNNFEALPTKPTFFSSSHKLRLKRNYYKNYNNYNNQLRDNPISSKTKSKQVMSKEEKIQKIQALLHDIKHKLEVHGNRLNGEMNELRVVKEKMEDFEKNKYRKWENDAKIDDDLLEKLRRALIRQYKTENKFAGDNDWDNINFKNERLMSDVKRKDEEDNFDKIHQQNRLNSLEYLDDKTKENLGTERNYNEMWLDRSNLQQAKRWSNTDRVADYQNKYDGRNGRIFELNRNDMSIQRSIINLDEKQDKSNLVEVNSENLKRSVNSCQEAISNVVEDKSNEINNNVAAQENSSPVYISQIYLINSNGSHSKIN